VRRILIGLLVLCPVGAVAAENLIENLRSESYNTTITDGVITQIKADPWAIMQWKFQMFFNNTKHMPVSGISFEQPSSVVNNNLGFISFTITMPDDLEDLMYFRFGLNGTERDTSVVFDVKNVMPNETYTLQWRVLNNIQGSVSWTDMLLVRCGDGYSLELGDSNCSASCENRDVGGGHIPPDAARVDEPDECTYTPANLICDEGYVKLGTACEQLCTAGITRVHSGQNVNVLYNRKLGTPSLCVSYNGSICYGRLAPGKNTGLNVNLNGTVYHLTD